MKRLIPAVAVVLAFAAQAQAVEPSFKDYENLSAADLAPRADALPASEILKHFPKGSLATGSQALAPTGIAPVANPRSSVEILAGFPQPSFQDDVRYIGSATSAQVAGRIEIRTY